MTSVAPQSETSRWHGARVLVGVAGGIAAYKAAHVVRGLVARGADVHVVPTPSSLAFVGSATWEALSHRPVRTSVFEDVDEVAHVREGQDADLVVVAPATADLLARLRAGRADDLLTASLLVSRAPVMLAPAMHTEMWRHPATIENVQVLRERGLFVLEPASGRLTGTDSGPGRLPEPEAILAAADAVLHAPRTASGAVQQDLAGFRVLVTAGGTREEIDPVRYIANHSSGKQGWAVAHAAAARGAEVTLIAASVAAETPPGVRRVDVRSAAELAAAVAEERSAHHVLVMAAAVADFTPATRADAKIKKIGEDDVPVIELARTEDILAGSVRDREGRRGGAGEQPARGAAMPDVIVGFAAETGSTGSDGAPAPGSALALAQEKARRKGADLLVFNDLTAGVFGADTNAVQLLDAQGRFVSAREGDKILVAHHILDEVVRRGQRVG